MNIKKIEKELDKELKEVEAWVKARKKFFIKLIWVFGILAIILILARIYLVF